MISFIVFLDIISLWKFKSFYKPGFFTLIASTAFFKAV